MDNEGRSPYAWLLWRHRWTALVLFLACPLIAWLARDRSQERIYTATALIVTEKLSVNVTTLPRYASVVFEAGQVAQTVAERGGLDIAPDKLIPGKIQLEPVQDSFLFRVVGRDENPKVAARLANDAADALVVELNKPGEASTSGSCSSTRGWPPTRSIVRRGFQQRNNRARRALASASCTRSTWFGCGGLSRTGMPCRRSR